MTFNKRTFLKMLAAAVGASPTTPLLGQVSKTDAEAGLRNWAGNLRYGTDSLTRLEKISDIWRHAAAG